MKYDHLDCDFKRRAHRIYASILERYAAKGDPKILDVGCSFGVIGALRGKPKNVVGIEGNPQLAKRARRQCEKVYQLDLNFFKPQQIKERNFDFIFCGDVLEHLVEPEKVLGQLIKLLAPQGLIIVSLPNVAQLFIRVKLLWGHFDYTETGVLDKNHLHFYTEKTARDMIQKAGLEIVDFYPSGTLVSFINLFPKLLAAQLIFVCRLP